MFLKMLLMELFQTSQARAALSQDIILQWLADSRGKDSSGIWSPTLRSTIKCGPILEVMCKSVGEGEDKP